MTHPLNEEIDGRIADVGEDGGHNILLNVEIIRGHLINSSIVLKNLFKLGTSSLT